MDDSSRIGSDFRQYKLEEDCEMLVGSFHKDQLDAVLCLHILLLLFYTMSKLGSSVPWRYQRLLDPAGCSELPAAGFSSTGHRCFGWWWWWWSSFAGLT